MPLKPLRSAHDEIRDHILDKLDSRLIGESELMQSLKRTIRIVARSEETVLITGESGTGKELIARGVHDLGARRNKPFLPINCGALTESLLESELFGHVKGSFTGAITNKKGFFEAASGGTIFLDEFAEMSLNMQQRLLRVLQEGTVRPVGSTDPKEIEIDSRVVVATNHDLKRDVSEGKFRNDLYYRVNVLEIRAPALRHRQEDILPLVQHFIRKYNEKNARQVSERIAPDVLAILEAYSWPGNVRELENITKRLALRVGEQGIVTEPDVRSVPELNQLANPRPLQCVESIEQHQVSELNSLSTIGKVPCRCRCSQDLDLYRRHVDQADGNLAEAARQLNMPRTTLRKRMMILERRCAP
ncbi:MAG: sigma-54 dependent transcriptional regulator [Acidobacteriota bacterium]|nr:sigma-54 dependent transcriptional regulator [Acidobacteriota bacterium]